ncbi:MAG: hypothetical protein VYC34_03700, partial [Planctomycetota bacterium]|nr:hypothetical protein [Planctomycetota bacterium]
QTLEQWGEDLDRALALKGPDGALVEHLSAYALTYEPNTAMTARMRRGEFDPATDELEAGMYLHAVERLRTAGFDRYEVSNFARGRDAESRHNLAYWRNDDWLAAGPSAAAHVAGHRWKNVPRLTDWMEGVTTSGGDSPIIEHEPPDPVRALQERLMMGLRIAEGLPADEVLAEAERIGAEERLQAAVRREWHGGLLELAEGRWRLTDDGFLQADGIAGRLMRAVSTG